LPNCARNWSPDIPLHLGMVVTGSLAHKRKWHHSKEATSGNLQLQIDSVPCLPWANGWYPSQLNQRLEFVPLWRQDFTPINRSRFHVLKEKKIKLKVGRKPAFPAHFSCNRSFLCLLSPPWLSATTIFITRLLSIIPTSSSH